MKFYWRKFSTCKGTTVKAVDEKYLTTLDNNGRFQIKIYAEFIGTTVIDVSGQVINRILFNDNREEGFGYSKRLTREIEKREIKRRLTLNEKAEK